MVVVFQMKVSIVTAVILSAFSSFAANATSVAQAEHNYDVAQRNYSAFERANGGTAMGGSTAEAIMNRTGEVRAQAYADARVAAEAEKAEQSRYGVKGDRNLTSQVNKDSNPAQITKTSQRPAGYVVTVHPPFAGETWGNHSDNSAGSENHGGRGNGGNNAANSNSAHGLGGGSNIGGGRSGGGFHY